MSEKQVDDIFESFGRKRRVLRKVEDFSAGEVSCDRCGVTFVLHYNGGELDQHDCCGLHYSTEPIRIDLIVSEEVSE